MERLLPQVDGRGRPCRGQRGAVAVADRCAVAGPARAVAAGTWARLVEHVQVRDDAVGRWSGPSRSNPPSTGTTSPPPEPAKGGRRRGRTGRSGPLADVPGPWPVPRWADHQGPPCRRRPGRAAVHRANPRERQRRHRVRPGAVRHPRSAVRIRPAPHHDGPGPGGQTAFQQVDALVPPAPWHHHHDPRTPRSGSQPQAARSARRQAARLRQDRLQ